MPLAYNSTILKKKMDLACGHFDYPFSKGRCKACAAQDRKPIKKISDKRSMSLEEEDIQVLIDECDAVFSKLVRVSEANTKGIGTCITCGAQKRWQDLQCGHYISRKHLATRFLRENCAIQCCGCNMLGHGRLDVFKTKLEERQKGLSDWLEDQSRGIWKPTRMELKELLVDFRNQLRIAQIKLIH
jgi:hypothetical protein